MKNDQHLKVGLAQISPVWFNKIKTLEKIKSSITDAADQGCGLVAFGEALLPGYPFWLGLTKGTDFDSPMQKQFHARYVQNAIQPEAGELDDVCKLAKQKKIAVYLGFIERAKNRGGHSLYCSLGYIDQEGQIRSVHRKLQPTYDERLAWSPGDGNGLRVHPLKGFTVGGLNCWENWMPLARAAMYAQGENVRVAVWPGSRRNTEDITRFIAKEARSYVVSVSALMRKSDFPEDTTYLDELLENAPEFLTDGGSCVAAPDGSWLVEPFVNEEKLLTATLDLNKVYEERQNFDPSGHYSRPDVTKLTVNRKRQSIADFED
jgi:nitrilase